MQAFLPLHSMFFGISSKKSVAGLLIRISFGLALLFHGITLYKGGAANFAAMTASDLGPLSPLGQVWGYILPALMIVGGALFVVGLLPYYATWIAGVALGSIPAGVLLKPILGSLDQGLAMQMTINALIWLLVFAVAVRFGFSCGCAGGSCGCGQQNCNCGPTK